MNYKLILISTVVFWSFTAFANITDVKHKPKNAETEEKTKILEHVQILGRSNKLSSESGSSTLIDELALEQFDYDDIHRVLATVPGVNIRQEDGYGLRPNIGFRGVTPERSKKINIMEDGVLIGPAPYSAPAAYYFPSVNRMTSVEIFKGPAAIKYGPNTVAGTLNMTTRSAPEEQEGQLEFGLGSNGYQKLHSFYGNTIHDIGFVIEGLNSSADGFKEIDNAINSLYSEDSGFDKNDYIVKLNYQTDGKVFGVENQQFFELKMSYADESSNETYMGLTDQDFIDTPFRRYAVSQVGNMDWQHQQFQFSYNISTENLSFTTRLYRHDFSRAWRKVNGFVNTNNPSTNRSLQDIIASPNEGINQEYYRILTGELDSSLLYQQLIVGTNDRSYYSQGLQLDLNYAINLFGIEQVIATGLRQHEDQINRNHFEQNYLMVNSVMTPSQQDAYFTTVNMESSKATSFYFEDTLVFADLELTFGSRAEKISNHYQNLSDNKEQDWLSKESTTWLYSASGFYKLNEHAGLFAGVHQGYVPTSPKQSPSVKPESSTNYEFGVRYNKHGLKLESVLFFNDFNNLKESCSFSTSASCVDDGLVDKEYNGGEVDVYGLEVSVNSRTYLTDYIDLPWSITYTNTQSKFIHDLDSTFELWGNVKAGDPVPYLPGQQLTLSIGLESNDWQLSILTKYTGKMHEASGDDVALSDLTTDEYVVIDLSANYRLDDNNSIYLKIDNVTDRVALVSRRPFGARPSKPQQFFIGYKYQF